MCRKLTFHSANVLLSEPLFARNVNEFLDLFEQLRHLPHGDKTFFYPHSVDNIMPDKCLYSQGHNHPIPKLFTSNPQTKWHLSPVSPQPCPQQNSRLPHSRCVSALLARKFHELKLSR